MFVKTTCFQGKVLRTKKLCLKVPFYLKIHLSNPKDAEVNYYLGRCYLALNDKKEAKKYFLINKKLNNKKQMNYINNSIRLLDKMI